MMEKIKGKISHEKALEKAHKEYDKYMKTHLTQDILSAILNPMSKIFSPLLL